MRKFSRYENDEKWDENVPADLIPALKALRKSFVEAHWKCGWITSKCCFGLLHPGVADEEVKEYLLPLQKLKAIVGPGATQRFQALLRQNTPSSLFKAFFDLYLDGTSIQAASIFKDLLEIGQAQEPRLGMSCVEWATWQAKHLIRSQVHSIDSWLKDVCDKQSYNPKEDIEEHILWEKWQAPRLVLMKPSQSHPYIAEAVWSRCDVESSLNIRRAFCDDYVLRLEVLIGRLAGQEAVKLAKSSQNSQNDHLKEGKTVELANQRKPAPESKPAVAHPVVSAQTNSGKVSIKQEYRKRKNKERNRKIRSEYRKLLKRKPNMSSVWYSEQLGRSEIACGLNSETIRKIIRD